jgi:hypothetical protein
MWQTGRSYKLIPNIVKGSKDGSEAEHVSYMHDIGRGGKKCTVWKARQKQAYGDRTASV